MLSGPACSLIQTGMGNFWHCAQPYLGPLALHWFTQTAYSFTPYLVWWR